MKICVLQADYSTTNVDYKNYDPPRYLHALRPNDVVDHVFLNKLTTYKQIKDIVHKKYDIFINLCEGYLEWKVPSIDVINTLDLLNLPYTGPSAILYDPPKPLMKYVAYCAGVKTPHSVVVNSLKNLENEVSQLTFPLFVKPAKAGDSLGVDDQSLVKNLAELTLKTNALIIDFEDVLIEEYIDGREFTVLIAANPDGKSCRVFTPVEYVFPENRWFKTYALKTSELHTDTNVPCEDPSVKTALETAAAAIFKAFGGVGYARLDFRLDSKNDLYFLEINFTCSVFYEDGYEGSADYILKYDAAGKSGFLQHIIEEGIARHQRKQKKYTVKGNGLSGYGIFATQFMAQNAVVFQGEGLAQRIISKKYVNDNWGDKEKDDFKHYAYPIGPEVYILWDENPVNWSPQNHSCHPNTVYKGLNVIALRDIQVGEELTLDYAQFLDENIEPFKCTCGSSNCRGIISGTKGTVNG
jgi:D-alanine-D-alanine ligase-like ATP-grasp enzyme